MVWAIRADVEPCAPTPASPRKPVNLGDHESSGTAHVREPCIPLRLRGPAVWDARASTGTLAKNIEDPEIRFRLRRGSGRILDRESVRAQARTLRRLIRTEQAVRDVMRAIEEKTAIYESQPFFAYLRDTSIDPQRRLGFAPSAAHYILTFTDFCEHVLREEPAKDRLQEIVNQQTYEEAEHSQWFITDLAKLGQDPLMRFSDALKFIWSDATIKSRMLSYRLCRLAMGADSLRKLVLVHCIEATADVTIKHVMMVGKEWTAGTGQALEFFGDTHENAEEHHGIWGEALETVVQDIRLSDPEVKRELLSLVDESFCYFTEFTNELLAVSQLERRVHES